MRTINKNYVFWCAKYKFKINIFSPKSWKTQKTIAVIKQAETKFNKKWHVWQNLFERCFRQIDSFRLALSPTKACR